MFNFFTGLGAIFSYKNTYIYYIYREYKNIKEDFIMVSGIPDWNSWRAASPFNKYLPSTKWFDLVSCFGFKPVEEKAPEVKIGSAPGFKDDYDDLILKYAEEY